MQLHTGYQQPVALAYDALPWLDSPEPGVQRKLLERDGEEVARATSIVRYAPGSAFKRHVHALGEEFLVLDGVFSDEQGDFPAGSYVRNPPGSAHSPYSKSGCEIFVKLRQMPPQERRAPRLRSDSLDACVDTLLFEADYEQVRILTLAAGRHRFAGAPLLELLVLEGGIQYACAAFGPKSWLRLPGIVELDIPRQARLYLKRHLCMPESTTS